MRKIYYLHVHKAGGKTFVNTAIANSEKVFQPSYNGNPHYYYGDLVSRIPFWRWAPSEQVNFIKSADCSIVCNEAFVGGGLPNDPEITLVSTIRDPLDRVYSEFRSRQRRNKIDATLSFAEFLAQTGPLPWWCQNRMTRQFMSGQFDSEAHIVVDQAGLINAKENARRFDLILVMERDYTQVSRPLSKVLNWAEINLNARKADHGAKRQSNARETLSDRPDLLEKIWNSNIYDIDLYDFIRRGPGARIRNEAHLHTNPGHLDEEMSRNSNMEYLLAMILIDGRNGDTGRALEALNSLERGRYGNPEIPLVRASLAHFSGDKNAELEAVLQLHRRPNELMKNFFATASSFS